MASQGPPSSVKDTLATESETEPFSSLRIWRARLDKELGDLPQSSDFKLRLLLEQGTDCEQSVLGCLNSTLHELHEASHWGFIQQSFVEAEEMQLYNQAATELKNDKNLVLELAKEHGLLEEYRRQVRLPVNHTVAGYRTLGELRFALLVWRANVSRDLSLAQGADDAEEVLREGYCAALSLVERCVASSAAFWGAQKREGAPGPAEKKEVSSHALEKVENWMREAAEAHHLRSGVVDGIKAELGGGHKCNFNELESSGEDRYELGSVH